GMNVRTECFIQPQKVILQNAPFVDRLRGALEGTTVRHLGIIAAQCCHCKRPVGQLIAISLGNADRYYLGILSRVRNRNWEMSRTAIIAGALASLMGLISVAPADAQIHVDFGFGHGHHGHHHWHHDHGWYYHGWY